MYSHLYEYFNICSDENYLIEKPTNEIKKALEETGVLIKSKNNCYSNSEKFPWINITLVKTLNGNYSESISAIPFSNLLTIVISKNEDNHAYLKLLKDISHRLGWKLFLNYEGDNVLVTT